MKIDFSDLTGNIAKDVELTERELVDLTAKITLDVHADLVLATPVDTGTARAGWTAETPTTPYESGIVENNVEYIGYLKDGHSPQAPSGFVDNIVQKHIHGGA